MTASTSKKDGGSRQEIVGSTVVHAVGGVTALIGAMLLGPRVGRFNADGTANAKLIWQVHTKARGEPFFVMTPGSGNRKTQACMSSVLLVLAVALGSGIAQAQTPASPHTLSANVGLYSEYIFRGTAQTAGEPALQGGFDYSHSSGFYAGTWASNISWLEDFGLYTRSSLEWDFYGGFQGNIGNSDFAFDVGTIYYYYPGNPNPGETTADGWEIYGGLGWKFLGLKYSYNLKDYFGARPNVHGDTTDGTWYLDFFVDYSIGDSGFSVNAHYGILDVKNDGTEAAGTKLSYNDWKIGATYVVSAGTLKDLTIGAYYADNNIKKPPTGTGWPIDGTGHNTAKSAFVVYVNKSF